MLTSAAFHKRERILQLVGDTGRELAQKRHFLGLYQLFLRLAQFVLLPAEQGVGAALAANVAPQAPTQAGHGTQAQQRG